MDDWTLYITGSQPESGAVVPVVEDSVSLQRYRTYGPDEPQRQLRCVFPKLSPKGPEEDKVLKIMVPEMNTGNPTLLGLAHGSVSSSINR